MANSNLESSILKQYEDKFPATFIKCIEEGASWLCFHNGITYQSSIVVKTDGVIYNTSDTDIIKLGLIDTSKPLSGLTYYGVDKVLENVDTITGNTTFQLECKYQTPVGIKVIVIPFKHFIPDMTPKPELPEMFTEEWFAKFAELAGPQIQSILAKYYTKEEADAKFQAKPAQPQPNK